MMLRGLLRSLLQILEFDHGTRHPEAFSRVSKLLDTTKGPPNCR
jgi:hypothetical protein